MSYVGKVNASGTVGLIGATLYGVCETQPATAAKTISSAIGIDSVEAGLSIHVLFVNSNTAENPTLQIDGSGLAAKPIRINSTSPAGNTPATSWTAGSVLDLTYDGAGWQITGWLNTDTTYSNATTSTAGLMSAADKTKLDAVDLNNIVTYTSKSVAANDWQTESTPTTYPGYGYYADVVLAATTVDYSAYVPTVIFTPQQVQNYGPAPVAVSRSDGKVRIYVENKPTEAITIPTIQLVKGVAGT